MESSTAGRVAIAILVAVVVLSIVVWNLPASDIKRTALPVVRPLVEAVGLDQTWEVFAPDPRRLTLGLRAEIEFADGSIAHWRLPEASEPLLSPYRTYRWQKWMESARSDGQRHLWDPTAAWLARAYGGAGREVVAVRLVRRWYDTPSPGEGTQRPPWNEFTYYVWEASGT